MRMSSRLRKPVSNLASAITPTTLPTKRPELKNVCELVIRLKSIPDTVRVHEGPEMEASDMTERNLCCILGSWGSPGLLEGEGSRQPGRESLSGLGRRRSTGQRWRTEGT